MEKEWINNKGFLRVLSLIIAVILWLYVVITQDPPRTNKVEGVEIICGLNQYQLNEGLIIVSKSSERLSFTASGKRSLVTGVRGTYYAKLNLDSISKPGKYNATPEISKPDGVYISGMEPPVVEVYVDKYVSSLIPVNVKTVGALPTGLVVKNLKKDAEQISVTTPSLLLEQIAYVGVTIDLSTINNSTIINCTPQLYDKSDNPLELKNVILDKKTVSIDVTTEKIKNVSVKPVVNSDGVDMSAYSMQFHPLFVDVYGDANTMDLTTEIQTTPLTLTQPPELGKEYSVELVLPTGLNLKDEDKKDVKIIFKQN